MASLISSVAISIKIFLSLRFIIFSSIISTKAITSSVNGASDAVDAYLSNYSDYDFYDDEKSLDKKTELDEVHFMYAVLFY